MDAEKDTAWVCLVCGYVHRGPAPPETCPVCGASREDFERQTEAAPAAKPAPKQWRCLICGYVRTGAEPAAACPVCGAPADDFEPSEAEPSGSSEAQEARQVAILGAGIAGLSAAEALREASPDAEITLVSKEYDLPYYRLNLTRFLAGEVAERALPVHPEDWYREQRIRLLRGAEVTRIRIEDGHLELRDGAWVAFEKLVVTCGAHPFIPPIPGAQREGVTPLRSLADAKRLREVAQPDLPCVCIGGGILGLETAGALAKHGADVTLLEGFDWLLPRQLNREAGRLLERHVEAKGIALRQKAVTAEILGDERAQAVLLADGAEIPAQQVVIATGVRPNSHLARRAGLEVNKGIVVDAHLATSHPDVLAAGDVAEHRGTLYGLWEPARYQGMLAGMNAAGQALEFGGLPRTNTLKVLGIDLFSIGVIAPQDASYLEVSEEREGRYFRFLFQDGLLVGSILLGDTHLAATVARALKECADCSGLLGKRPSARDVAAFLDEHGA